MSTQTEAENIPSTETVDKYLKLAATPNKDDKAVVKLRLLDYPGIELFRHWIGEGDVKYPYNCPGPRGGCPACRERSLAKIAGEDYKQIHRMDHRRVVNVLDLTEKDNPKLKVYQITPSVEKSLKFTTGQEEEDGKVYSDPTTYDIKIIKQKTGNDKFDIDYAVQYVAHRELTPTEKALAANKFDLTPETAPAQPEVIGAAIKGQRPASQLATDAQKAEVDKVLKAQKLSYSDLKVTNPDALTSAKAQEIVRDLG